MSSVVGPLLCAVHLDGCTDSMLDYYPFWDEITETRSFWWLCFECAKEIGAWPQ